MPHFKLNDLLLILVLYWTGPAAARDFHISDLQPKVVQTFECASLLDARPRVKLQNLDRVVFAAWNPEGVSDLQGKFEANGVNRETETYAYRQPADPARELAPWKFAAKQQKILDLAPDFVVAPEVESVLAAERWLNEGALAGRYRTFLTRGNDIREIDIAFAVRADLDVTVDMESHAEARWFDPIEGVTARVFTRDLPALIIRDRASDRVLFVLIGQHAKSMRSRARGRDHRSNILRAAQFRASRRIVDSYRARFGEDVPIIMAGDFNTDVPTAQELRSLKRILHDAFDVVGVGVGERATHTYHPGERESVPTQLDAFLVSDVVKPFVRDAYVAPEYHPQTGLRLGVPRSLRDRLQLYPSDHRAIALVLDGALFRRADTP